MGSKRGVTLGENLVCNYVTRLTGNYGVSEFVTDKVNVGLCIVVSIFLERQKAKYTRARVRHGGHATLTSRVLRISRVYFSLSSVARRQ